MHKTMHRENRITTVFVIYNLALICLHMNKKTYKYTVDFIFIQYIIEIINQKGGYKK